jgi:hypothetical protein
LPWAIIVFPLRGNAANRVSQARRRTSRVKFVFPLWGNETVEVVFAGAAVFDQACLLELGEVGGEGALAHDQDFLELSDGKLFGAQEQEDAEAVGVGHHA